MALPRDLPRAAAPILFGLFDVASGVAGYGHGNQRVLAYAKAARLMPLNDWALGFTALGALILFGALDRRLAWITSLIALFWWLTWASFIYQQVGQPGVTPRAVTTTGGLAVLHTLLVPYRRRRPPPADGT